MFSVLPDRGVWDVPAEEPRGAGEQPAGHEPDDRCHDHRPVRSRCR